MNTPAAPLTPVQHPFPGVRTGGLFLLIVGTGIVAGGMLGKQLMFPIFFVGFAAAFVALALFRRRLTRAMGTLTRVQLLALPAAIALEIALIAIVVALFHDELAHGETRHFTFAILFVVGVHFVVFAISSGPLMLLLAALCCANAIAGFLIPAAPVTPLWILDGLMKVGIGVAMFQTPVRGRNRQPSSSSATD